MNNISLRDSIEILEANNLLLRVKKEVDPRYISTLIAQGKNKAVLLEKIKGYQTPVVGGVMNELNLLALALNVSERNVGQRMRDAVYKPIEPLLVDKAPVQEVVFEGDEVDLSALPIPLQGAIDGGPYISAGMVVSKDPEYGRNCGYYRLMYNDVNTLGIGLVSPSDMRAYYDRALKRNLPLEVAIAVGVHPIDTLAATYKAPIGVDEFAIAGGLRKSPLEIVKCKTVGLEVPANAEIVIEGELLPIGYTVDEGRFGEFTRFTGKVQKMPLIKVRAITQRRDPIFQTMNMPWENITVDIPAYEGSAWQVLEAAGVETKTVHVTKGGCGQFHVIASIKKRGGEGKNAVMALLSSALFKLAIVVDDDIDVYDMDAVEWAVFSRVQADKDVIIISGARAKPLDPSVSKTQVGGLPLTSKLGIDATMPEDIPRENYDTISYPFMDKIKLEEYLA
jgi:2,5-furandicarboxylate decarboxylase 1